MTNNPQDGMQDGLDSTDDNELPDEILDDISGCAVVGIQIVP